MSSVSHGNTHRGPLYVHQGAVNSIKLSRIAHSPMLLTGKPGGLYCTSGVRLQIFGTLLVRCTEILPHKLDA